MKNVYIGLGDTPAATRELIKTKTGEFFQPIRLYFRINGMSGVRVAFKKLRCIDYEADDNHWVWVYDNEAKKIQFEISFADIHPDDKPLILGIFSPLSDSQLCLDVGSIDRALKAIAFFGKHIKPFVAKIEYAAIYNKLPANRNEYPGIRYDKLFAGVDTDVFDQKAAERQSDLETAISSGAISDVLGASKFDLIEGFRVDTDEDGMKQLLFQLHINQAIAFAKLKGHKDAKLSDLVAAFLKVLEEKSLH